MAARLVKRLLPGSPLVPPKAHGGGGPSGLPCGVLPMPPSRAPRPAVVRVAKNNSGAAENLLGLPNGGPARQTNPRDSTRSTKKQLQEAAEHPKDIHHQLSMVDVLEKIGISQHFAGEIKSILDAAYRETRRSCWTRRHACAMAFRILRMNGYDISSDALSHLAEASSGLNGTRSLLELYKASQVSISGDEIILDSIGSWSGRLLKEELTSSAAQRSPLLREVEHALNTPFYATLDRLEHKRNIEQSYLMDHKMLHLSLQTNQELLALGVMDFSTSQSIYQQELELLNSWVKESRLDQLPLERMKLAYFYLSAAGTMVSQELSDARIFC